MQAPDHIINRIKLLLNLSQSDNPNEAETSKKLAQSLMDKYNLTEDFFKDIDKPSYSNEHLVYQTSQETRWKQVLITAIAKKYDCFVIRELQVASSGEEQICYFCPSDPEEVNSIKTLFLHISSNIENLYSKRCTLKNQSYKDSYIEGMLEGIRELLEYLNPTFKVKKELVTGNSDQVLVKQENSLVKKEPKIKEVTSVQGGSMVGDVIAYFAGISDSSKINIDGIVEGKILP